MARERFENLEFPCACARMAPNEARLLGVYEQRQEGLLMQRVKVPGGRITAGQIRALAKAAERFGPGYPLHLTTRQDIEFHGVTPDSLPALQEAVAATGLTGMGACGDTLRNVTACAGCRAGCCGDCCGWDVSGLAEAVRQVAEALPFIRAMPRKFKISISCCSKGCARPWISDLGLIATPAGKFDAVVAGSLGARPATGVKAYEDLDAADILPLVVASLRLFNREGNRENRSRARFRHVRERMGDEEFLAAVDAAFAAEKESGEYRAPALVRAEDTLSLAGRLHPPLGDIAPGTAMELADFLEENAAEARIGLEHDIFIFAAGGAPLPTRLDELTRKPSIVACPGNTWCARGIADSRALAGLLLGDGAADGLRTAISGCPNNCSHAAVADIGLVGRVKTIGGVRREAFRLLAGGDNGAGPRLAAEIHPAVPAGDVPGAVRLLSGEYEKRGGAAALPFAEFIHGELETLRALVGEKTD